MAGQAEQLLVITSYSIHYTKLYDFSFEFRQEEVLQDILRDPFARKVFEDIYNQVRQGSGKPLSYNFV